LPLKHRRGVVALLLLSAIAQLFNQAARLVFRTYEMQSTFPGTVWVNVFFAVSFVCAFVGGVWMAAASEHVRRREPDKFGPGPIQVFLASRAGQVLCRVGRWVCCCCGCDVEVRVAKLEVEAQERENREAAEHHIELPRDPTTSEIRSHRFPRRGSRTELRMFGM
jgi:hypothetical protein